MSNTQTPPGLMLPTQKPYPVGAGNPRDAAMVAGQLTNLKQSNLNASVGGKKRYRGGAEVIVPQMQILYDNVSGDKTGPNAQIAGLSSTGMQSSANAVYDNQAAKMGGSKKKRGGSSDWSWGCYSGGKRRTRRNKSRSRKNKRKSRHHRRY